MLTESLQWNVIRCVCQQCHLLARAVFSILKNNFQEDVFLFHSKSNIRLSVFVLGKGGEGGSLLLNKRLFTILSFELNIEISLKMWTPMTYECDELRTSKWGHCPLPGRDCSQVTVRSLCTPGHPQASMGHPRRKYVQVTR